MFHAVSKSPRRIACNQDESKSSSFIKPNYADQISVIRFEFLVFFARYANEPKVHRCKRTVRASTKLTSAVSAGGVVRESSETRWHENRLLAALPDRERARLMPQLEILTLFAKETVYESGEEMNYAYFPLDCIVVLISSVE